MANLSVLDGTGATQALTGWTAPDGSLGAETRINARRGAQNAYRSGIVATDTIANVATQPTYVSSSTGGSLTSGTSYYVAMLAVNEQGSVIMGTTANSLAVAGPQAPGASNTMSRYSITRVTGAYGYLIFFGASATAPALVVFVTDAQVAGTSGLIVTTSGTLLTSGSAPTGSIDIGVIGSGIAYNNAQFANNTAYVIPGATPIPCADVTMLILYIKVTPTSSNVYALYATAMTLTLVPFYEYQGDSSYYAGDAITVNLTNVVGGSLQKELPPVPVYGAVNVHFLVAAIPAGTVAIQVEPA